MPTPTRRLAAAATAALIALLTAAAVGLVSPQPTCRGTAAGTPVCAVAGFEPVPAVVALVGALAAGFAAVALLVTAGRRTGRRPAPGLPRPDRDTDRTVALHPGGSPQAQADRAALIDACIHVRDRTTSPALADRLAAALDVAGVRTVEPTGARFDPAHHEAGGAAPSTDPARVGTIAAVEVPGYLDRDGRALRVPVVTVFRTATTTDREER